MSNARVLGTSSHGKNCVFYLTSSARATQPFRHLVCRGLNYSEGILLLYDNANIALYIFFFNSKMTMPPRSCCTTILLGEYLAQLAYKLGDKCHTISCVKLTTLTVWSPTDRCNVRLAVIGNTHRRIHYIFAQLGRSRR